MKASSLAAFASGLVFALGLGLSGMAQPSKVLGFLDVAGRWDPSLAFVMGGAVLLGLVSFAPILRRPAPLLEPRFHLPEKRGIDARLLAGAALFGVGWGLSRLPAPWGLGRVRHPSPATPGKAPEETVRALE
jgi:uncharacterized membrane protein YedE/YeeE